MPLKIFLNKSVNVSAVGDNLTGHYIFFFFFFTPAAQSLKPLHVCGVSIHIWTRFLWFQVWFPWSKVKSEHSFMTLPCLFHVPSSPFLHMLTVHQQQQQQHVTPQAPVQCDVPLNPLWSPSSFVAAHLCTQQEGAPATVHPAWPHTGPYIDALQLFPNPALDFDPLPFFI